MEEKGKLWPAMLLNRFEIFFFSWVVSTRTVSNWRLKISLVLIACPNKCPNDEPLKLRANNLFLLSPSSTECPRSGILCHRTMVMVVAV